MKIAELFNKKYIQINTIEEYEELDGTGEVDLHEPLVAPIGSAGAGGVVHGIGERRIGVLARLADGHQQRISGRVAGHQRAHHSGATVERVDHVGVQVHLRPGRVVLRRDLGRVERLKALKLGLNAQRRNRQLPGRADAGAGGD